VSEGKIIMAAEKITWGELGCPTRVGEYRVSDEVVQVKKIHIIVAENNPAALFTVVAIRPPMGPEEFMLGHRIA
jgi:hypothetical protein